MTELLQFVVPGPPVAKARARVAIRGGKVHAFTPKKTESYEGAVRMAFCAAYPDFTPIEGPVELMIYAYFLAPKYMRRGTNGTLRHAKRPDADNIAKSIADSLNGVAWRDDSQVSDLVVRKRYALAAEVVVEIRRLT